MTETIPEVEPGHYVPHFEAKADVSAYLAKSGQPYTVRFTFHDTVISQQCRGCPEEHDKTCHKICSLHAYSQCSAP